MHTTTADIDLQIVQRQHSAFAGLADKAGRAVWPPVVGDLFPDTTGLPEVEATELTAEQVASGIVHHGSLLVRNLIDAEQVAVLVDDIDRAMAGHDAWKAGAPVEETAPWFVPFHQDEGYPNVAPLRKWIADGGGCWAADSPKAFSDLRDVYGQVGLRRVIAEYLGEQPVISVNKATLRRVPHDLAHADWHQDGAFLDRGTGIHTVNVWLALTDCGVDAPGLDVLPGRRFDVLAERGTNGAYFDWSVGHGTVEQMADERPIVRPHFRAGDALLFDEMNLHRTALEPGMEIDRYAIECWFFAPSTYPTHHVPVVF